MMINLTCLSTPRDADLTYLWMIIDPFVEKVQESNHLHLRWYADQMYALQYSYCIRLCGSLQSSPGAYDLREPFVADNARALSVYGVMPPSVSRIQCCPQKPRCLPTIKTSAEFFSFSANLALMANAMANTDLPAPGGPLISTDMPGTIAPSLLACQSLLGSVIP